MQEQARQLGDVKARLSAGKARVEQIILRRERLEHDLLDVEQQSVQEHEQLGEARLLLQEALLKHNVPFGLHAPGSCTDVAPAWQ